VIPQIDLGRQHESLRQELLAAAARVLDSTRFVLGPEVRALEAELAAFGGAAHGIGVNSGTDALLMALKAVGVRPGDEVITSSFSFVASATTVLMAGAVPVFVDIDPGTFNLDPVAVARAVTARTRAIMPVHLYGQMAAMDAIEGLARERGLAVVADAAQAVGATYDGRPVGTWGDAICLSFYPTKNLGACGDGGMVLTPRDDVADRVRRLRDHGSARKYEHVELGYASRLDELQAALLRVKLGRLREWNELRRAVAARYRVLLGGLPIGLPAEAPGAWHVYHQYTVRVPERDAVVKRLADMAVGTAVHYPRMIPGQPLFAEADAERRFPEAGRAAREVLSLPCFPELTEVEIQQVAESLRRALA
jgi:UDP-N-acetyl-3-dehydro-alpha-D-glucosamine 3-aminotranferase